ncbi:GAF domain-containing protein [Pricia sp. S334]|uniref:GAF domain-containing protein n=1 Tax=Pricia mediterranea TaxID=3076079 RepID=A0ABU3L4U6_9FLAO|nr:GAF domain-containing protein [Pricia sp. S334]MDT7828769.1 GAF domain-containing protein [Pricia sp. S334]
MEKIERITASLEQSPVDWQELLSECITSFGCSTGTLHFLETDTDILKLQAQIGIPEFLMPKVSKIPIGKGMAGIAAERQEPVELCNLQTDTSGIARPAAKETKVEGSIAVPMMFNGALYGTLGIAKPVPYDFTEEEKNNLMAIGEAIARTLA